MSKNTEVLIDGLTFTEGPRWHEGKLYFSDFFSHRVLAVDTKGNFILTMNVAITPELVAWIMGWHRNVKVLKFI